MVGMDEDVRHKKLICSGSRENGSKNGLEILAGIGNFVKEILGKS